MGFITTIRIDTIYRFTEFNEALEVSINEALVEWANLALDEISSGAPVGHDKRGPGPHFKKPNNAGDTPLADSFRIATIPIFGGFGSLKTADMMIFSNNPVAIWQELGTRSSRSQQLKLYRRKGEGPERSSGTGVPALHFIRDGFRRAQLPGQKLVQAAIAGVGRFDTAPTVFDTHGGGFLDRYTLH